MLGTKVFIRERQVDTGAQQDNIALPQVLQSQYDQHAFFPDFVAGDMKYGYGKTRAQVAELTGGQTQIIALIPTCNQRSDLGPRDFTLSDDGLFLTCPNNLTTARRYLTQDKGGADFRSRLNCVAAIPGGKSVAVLTAKKVCLAMSSSVSTVMKLKPPRNSTRPTPPSRASKNE